MNFSKKAISLAGILLIVVQSLPAQVRQTREEYIDRYKSIAVAHMERYGIPASITMAQGILESDCGNSALVMERVSALAGEGFTVIFSTHDPNQAFRYATQALALQGGGVLAAGRPEKALTSETLTKLYGVGMAVCPVTAAGKSFSVAVVTGGKTQ